MKILSIDVGIKNLAFCLFDKPTGFEHFKISKWDISNISEEEVYLCCFKDKNELCNKPAKFKKDNQCYCLKHSKKQTLQIPTSEHKPSFINKQKIQKLFEIADHYGIKYNQKVKKQELVQLINDYINNNYFEMIEKVNASDVNLYNIGNNIKIKFNQLFQNEERIDYVIIENQISPIATRMKTIQGMIVQYFIMSNLEILNIEFISASNKLKVCNKNDVKNEVKKDVKNTMTNEDNKTKYSDRKKLGITKCLEIITNDFRFNEHLGYFNQHKKKDDLSDSFLQGLWFINDRKI